MEIKTDEIKVEIARSTYDACQAIAKAAELATVTLANAAESAKNVIANDAAKAIKTEDSKKVNDEKSNSFSNLLYKQISLGMSIISMFGVVLGVFIYITGPTKDNDTALQLQDARITAQREIIDNLTKTAQNDTVEVKSAVKDLTNQVNILNTGLATLTAIIDERIPAKK